MIAIGGSKGPRRVDGGHQRAVKAFGAPCPPLRPLIKRERGEGGYQRAGNTAERTSKGHWVVEKAPMEPLLPNMNDCSSIFFKMKNSKTGNGFTSFTKKKYY